MIAAVMVTLMPRLMIILILLQLWWGLEKLKCMSVFVCRIN